ncbi:MAG: hypothetical protein GY855_02705, partial [candidate division Zixibacteria bacterium]|nr:hypothetical protein [candidate division Zixibacteria bacterium]
MKKILLITALFAVALISNAFAGTSHIANNNPVGGDILAADTCDFSAPDLVLFSQLPEACDGAWALVTSDSDLGYFVYDDYEAFGTITDIHFWGGELHYGAAGWEECDEDPATFTINFVPDTGAGSPDEANPACTYTVTLTHNPVAVCVLNGVYDVWEWFTVLDPVCNLQQGWVGVQGLGNGDTCVFMWYNSTENVFGYNSWQNGGYTTYHQAFCLTGEPVELCLICSAVGQSPRVPREGGTIQWDLTVSNCGSQTVAPVWGEIVPTNIDCNGPQYDFNLYQNIYASLAPGASFTNYYYYMPMPGTVPYPTFIEVALWTFIGTAPNNYTASCCFEFIFTTAWGRGEGTTWGENGEWGVRDSGILPSASALGQNYPNP